MGLIPSLCFITHMYMRIQNLFGIALVHFVALIVLFLPINNNNKALTRHGKAFEDNKSYSMRRKDDILWKVILEEIFDDLLRFVFPRAGKLFDLKRGFEYLDKELSELNTLPDKGDNTLFVDKLVKVFRKEGGGEWVLIHIEVQGRTNPKAFAERMFRYFIRIFERHGKPVTALAIFTGSNARSTAANFRYECLGTRLTFEYNRLSILDFSDRQLDQSANPFAVVLRVAKMALLEGKRTPQWLLDEKVLIAKRLFARGFSKQKIKAIFAFLEGSVQFKKRGLNRIFKRRIESHDKLNIMGIDEYLKQVGMEKGLAKGRKEGREKGREEGREEGRNEGREEGRNEGREEERRLFVQNLLSNTDFDNEKIALLANLPLAYVMKMRSSKKG